MLTKKQVISAVKNMPDNFDTIQLFDRILLINKVEEGRQQIKEGKGLSTGEARKKMAFLRYITNQGYSRIIRR
jgi:hypothetical protein